MPSGLVLLQGGKHLRWSCIKLCQSSNFGFENFVTRQNTQQKFNFGWSTLKKFTKYDLSFGSPIWNKETSINPPIAEAHILWDIHHHLGLCASSAFIFLSSTKTQNAIWTSPVHTPYPKARRYCSSFDDTINWWSDLHNEPNLGILWVDLYNTILIQMVSVEPSHFIYPSPNSIISTPSGFSGKFQVISPLPHLCSVSFLRRS